MIEKLTDARVRGAKPIGRRYSIMDSVCEKLELRISEKGRKTFALRHSVAGRDVRVTLGGVGRPARPEVLQWAGYGPDWQNEFPGNPRGELSLSLARRLANTLKLRFDKSGRDFRAEERAAQERREADNAAAAQRRAFTVRDLARAWRERAEKAGKPRQSTIQLHVQRLNSHVLPALGDIPVGEVKRADVRKLVNAIAERGAHVTANRVASLVSMLYQFGQSELDRDDANPAANWRRLPEQARERCLADDEIRGFWLALSDPEIPPGPQTAIVLKLALLTTQRIGEIVGARDNEFNVNEGLWTVPGHRTKSGNVNLIPLTPAVVALFERAWDLRGGAARNDAPVFASPRQRDEPMRRHSVSRGMSRLCEKLNMQAASPHDLRRTARSLLARERLGVSFETAERLLSHRIGSRVAAVYNQHRYVSEKRQAMEALYREIVRIVEDRPIERSATVVELRG